MKHLLDWILILGTICFLNGCAVFHPDGRHMSQWAIDKYWDGSPDASQSDSEGGADESSASGRKAHSPAAIPLIFVTGLLDAVFVNPVVSIPPSVRTASQAGHATGLVVAAPIITKPLAPLATILTFAVVFPLAEVAYLSIPGLLPP